MKVAVKQDSRIVSVPTAGANALTGRLFAENPACHPLSYLGEPRWPPQASLRELRFLINYLASVSAFVPLLPLTRNP